MIDSQCLMSDMQETSNEQGNQDTCIKVQPFSNCLQNAALLQDNIFII